MAWPSKTVGGLYSSLYSMHQTNAFHRSFVRDLLRDDLKAKVYVHRLKKFAWAYQSQIHGRGFYRLHTPETCVLISSGRLKNILRVEEQAYSGLIAACSAEVLKFDGLKSLVLFGSVARGDAKANSDVDMLGIFDSKTSVEAALDATGLFELRGPVSEELRYLRAFGIETGISLLPMTERQFLIHPFVLLDIVSDGIPIIDDGIFARESLKINHTLKKIGAKRIYLSRDDWYWDLLPGQGKGATIII